MVNLLSFQGQLYGLTISFVKFAILFFYVEKQQIALFALYVIAQCPHHDIYSKILFHTNSGLARQTIFDLFEKLVCIILQYDLRNCLKLFFILFRSDNFQETSTKINNDLIER